MKKTIALLGIAVLLLLVIGGCAAKKEVAAPAVVPIAENSEDAIQPSNDVLDIPDDLVGDVPDADALVGVDAMDTALE